jgi:N-methylhydantoinase B
MDSRDALNSAALADGTDAIAYDPISVEIMWNKLISIVNEAANALVRSSFSTIVREANDYACVLMDENGNSLAESTASIPCFNATLPQTMKYFLEKYPKATWKPGDVVITNDPWMGTGHLPDFTIASPVFVKGRLVAYAGTIAHASDVGGTLLGADTQEVFQEGLRIPVMKILSEGNMNEDLAEIVKANVRVPDQVMGDLYAQITAAELCAGRLLDFMEEQGLQDITSIAKITQRLAEEAMRKAIKKIPEGVYTYSVETDGFETPFVIRATITVKGEDITVDYEGTSPQTDKCAVNSPMCYTYAYTAYPIKCAIDPETPRNDGSYRPIHVVAPPRTIVNALFPAAVNARHLTGHLLSSALYGALADVLPDRVIAESGGAPNLRGLFSGMKGDGKLFSFVLFGGGGMGARPDRDGLPCTGFPSNSTFGSTEVIESVTPLLFWKKEMVRDSGGAGKFRGGCGQRMMIQLVSELPATVSFRAERIRHPALGLFGGAPGGKAQLRLFEGQPWLPVDIRSMEGRLIDPKGRTALVPGDTLEVVFAGGGGYGPPEIRDRALVKEDLKNDTISTEVAEGVYELR